jgi:hypothetical protein
MGCFYCNSTLGVGSYNECLGCGADAMCAGLPDTDGHDPLQQLVKMFCDGDNPVTVVEHGAATNDATAAKNS